MNMKQTLSMVVAILAIVIVGAVSIFLFRKNYNAPAQDQNPVNDQNDTSQSLDNRQPTPTVGLGSQPGVGDYLTDQKGMTLYYFDDDAAGKSNCNAACAAVWPAFYSPVLSVAQGLDTADFGIITRDGGAQQTTYKGWPLYYYSGDVRSGDIIGNGFDDLWHIVSPGDFKPAAKPAEKPSAAATTVRLSPQTYPQVQPIISGTGLTGVTGGGYDY